LISATCVASDGDPRGSGTLDWQAGPKGVDADIEGWSLPRVIATISRATGWQTYLEPDTGGAITAHFENLDGPAALRRLLGDLNFALLPQVAGPPRLFVYQHSFADATRFIPADTTASPKTPASRPVGNELIVRRKRGSKQDIEELAKRLGARVTGRVPGVDAYRLAFDDDAKSRDARRALSRDDDIESVEDNVVLPPPEDLTPITASDGVGTPLSRDFSPSKDEVIVALIDSAVQAEGLPSRAFLRDGLSVFGDYRPPQDNLTHGTAMAATIIDGVARAVLERDSAASSVPLSILPVDVYGPNQQTTTFDVGRGLEMALDNHANVVNLSLGGDTDSPFMRSLIGEASGRGVLFFAAAGNMPVTTPMYPAADPGVVSVTASDVAGGIAPYANRGAWVDTMAPGMNVVGYLDRSWYGAGTSFATSWVSGWAAGYMTSSRRPATSVMQQTLTRWAIPTNIAR
jgi:hypothetical protein